MTQAPGDAALIAAARSGSDAAFAALVNRHQQAVRSFLMRVCGNAADADDLAQETFLAAWTALSSLRRTEQLKSWLFGIAWRKAQGAARSAARTRRREREWSDLRPASAGPAGEARAALEAALSLLSPDQRAAIALCLGAGFSHAEAAGVLDMPAGTIKSHIARGRARLAAAQGESDA